ncbi:hypothetical protein QVD17_42405 [Tagetes erecta]|uniref:Uncharacterized protein n=1 Tax=Tagetes erecta TaxID=13708 RepID=A0AAD8JK03_TARER|nr:hypothetical protein QVD17_42405 [Tagetes erecta]
MEYAPGIGIGLKSRKGRSNGLSDEATGLSASPSAGVFVAGLRRLSDLPESRNPKAIPKQDWITSSGTELELYRLDGRAFLSTVEAITLFPYKAESRLVFTYLTGSSIPLDADRLVSSQTPILFTSLFERAWKDTVKDSSPSDYESPATERLRSSLTELPQVSGQERRAMAYLESLTSFGRFLLLCSKSHSGICFQCLLVNSCCLFPLALTYLITYSCKESIQQEEEELLLLPGSARKHLDRPATCAVVDASKELEFHTRFAGSSSPLRMWEANDRSG